MRHDVSASRFNAAVAAAVVDCDVAVKNEDELTDVADDCVGVAVAEVCGSTTLKAPFANDTVSSSSIELVDDGVELLPSSSRAPGGDGSNVGEYAVSTSALAGSAGSSEEAESEARMVASRSVDVKDCWSRWKPGQMTIP